jgi:hypothetical protein
VGKVEDGCWLGNNGVVEPHCTASRGGEEGDEVSGKRWRVGAQPESSRRFKSPLFFPSAAFKFTHGHVLISIFL